MKNWKRLLCLGLGFCMILGNPAYGDMEVAPNPIGNGEVAAGQGLPGQETAGRTLTVGEGQSQANGQGIAGQSSGNQSPGAMGAGTSGNQGPGALEAGASGNQGPGAMGAGAPGNPGPGAMGAESPGNQGAGVMGAGSPGNQAPGGEQGVSETGGSKEQGQPEGSQSGETGAASQASLPEPEIAAEGAVLLDASTGKVLYGKNADQQFYPASITKVMTALLVLERCSLNDVVTFSASATTNLESGAVSLDITEGDRLTVEQCLYGLLLKSANEIGNGLAEHVAGSVANFAGLMNERAAQLGCTNTHFANPHGLNDSTHRTTSHDMALIMRAALQNETFRRIATTCTYDFPATKKAGARTITMGHKMMYPSDSRYYEGIIGGKTGYTSLAGNTLVTGVERNGVRLIVVIMKAKQTHYTDTKALLDYGFANYQSLAGTSAQPESGGSLTQGPGAGPGV